MRMLSIERRTPGSMKNSQRRNLRASAILLAQRDAAFNAKTKELLMSDGQKLQLADWRAAQRKLHAHPASPPTRRLEKARTRLRFKAHSTLVNAKNGNGYAASGTR